MGASFHTACFLVLLAICSVQGNIPRVCGGPVQNGSRGILPKLPRAFTTMIEAKIVNANFTMLLTEYYDDIENRGAVTRINDRGNGGSVHEIFDYDSDEVISIDQVSGKCVVYPLKDFHSQLFGYRFVDHRLHIKGVSEVLQFGNLFNETYMGKKYVRGILCDHWQACVNTNLVSIIRDYYFASSAWTSPWQNPVIPVRAEAKGHAMIPFHHVYDFFSFVTGSPDAKQYDIPRGTFCPGKKNTNNGTLPAPKWFSLDSEWVYDRNKSIHHFREFYDSDLNLFRIDQRNLSKKAATRGTFKSEIHDYNTGVRYVIYNTTGATSCEMSVLDTLSRTWDAATTPDSHHVRLKTSREMLFLTNFSQFGYEGVARLRGFEADVWSTRWRRPNATAEIYFLRPDWKFTTDAGLEEKRTPVRWTVNGRWGQWVSNIYNFDASPQDVRIFDIGACYSRLQKREVGLSFRPLRKDIVVDENAFRKALRQTISRIAKVTLIRIADIKVSRSPPEFDELSVTFYLLDPPRVKVNVTQVDSPSRLALKDLEESVTQKLFVVTFQTPAGTTQKLTADPKTFYIDDSPQSTTPTTPTTPTTLSKCKDDDDDDSDKVLTKGEVAGLAIGMLILGLILGAIITIVFKKCGLLNQYDFKRQDDTPTVPTAPTVASHEMAVKP